MYHQISRLWTPQSGLKKITCASSKLVETGKADAGFLLLNYITFLYTFYCLSIFTAHFIYINCLLFACIELLSKGDFKDVNVTEVM